MSIMELDFSDTIGQHIEIEIADGANGPEWEVMFVQADDCTPVMSPAMAEAWMDANADEAWKLIECVAESYAMASYEDEMTRRGESGWA